MISAQTLRVCREGKPVSTFQDHALAALPFTALTCVGHSWPRPRWLCAMMLTSPTFASSLQRKLVAVGGKHRVAVVKGLERGSVADRDHGGLWKYGFDQTVETGFGRLVEGSRRLVEKEILRGVQQRARNPEPLLLAERQHLVPMRLGVEPALEFGQANREQRLPDALCLEGCFRRGIGDRLPQRADRQVWPLRQHHQRGVRRDCDRAAAERPDAGNRAEQG